MSALDEVLERIERTATARLPVVVFDLDSTLFNTGGRNLQILGEFAEERTDYPELAQHVPMVGLHEMGWDVSSPLRRRDLGDEALYKALRQFWFERFFTNEYVLHDHPAPGAPEFVRSVHDRGALVYYLTGRHVGGMEVGTVRALTNAGFPYWRGRCVLHLKPNFHMADKPFKAQAIRDLRSHHGEVVATFENEPGNANVLRDAFPDALHFLFGNVHSPEAEDPHPALVPIDDFYV